MAKVSLLKELSSSNKEAVGQFIWNRMDNGDFENADLAEDVEVDRSELPGWRYEFARFLMEQDELLNLPAGSTNVDLVRSLMTHSQFGALAQAFIIEAITRYAKQVSNSTPEQYGENSIVAPESWIGVGKEIKTKMDAFYKRTN